MAKIPTIGEMRVNPQNFTSEIWNGKMWVDTVTPQMVSGITTNVGSSYTTIANNGITSATVSSKPTISATERELIFEFLKDNMRVAEYLDENNKIHTVQLEMRAGPGFVWEQITRVKTKNPL